jgi:hypothetical protein
MTEYKKQHFLPASYLRYFSKDQSKCRRDSRICQFDGKETRNVSVASQCYGKYFYSKKSPADVELMFQKREQIYCSFVDTIRAGHEIEIQNFGDLFLCMCDLNLRNAAHVNSTGEEGIDAYDARLGLFFSGLLLAKGEANLEVVKYHLQTNWRMEILPAPSGFQFVTSDHPTVFMTCDNPPNPQNPLQIIMLALDPMHIAVAFDRRFVSIERTSVTVADINLFNIGQVHNATRFIYSAIPIAGDGLPFFENVFLQKKGPQSEITTVGWRLSLAYLPPQSHYSFIRIKT